MNGKSIAAVLGACASIATILGFLESSGNGSPPVVPPTQPTTVVTTLPTVTTSAVAVWGTAAEQSFLGTCESYTGLPVSHCQCDLSWAEANYAAAAPTSPVQDMAMVEEAENNALCP